MAEKPEGVTLKYQGKICSALPFLYSRDEGLEPSFGFVHMLREDFKDFTIREALRGVDTVETLPLSQNKTADKSVPPAQITKVVERGFLSAGELVFSEVYQGEEHAVTFQDVLVTERAVETIFATDDDNPDVRVEITDIRYLWGKRGEPLFEWINLPKQQGPRPGSQDASAEEMLPGSLDQGGPWTLRRVLEVKVLPKLPGSPKLRRLPAKLEKAISKGYLWERKTPKEALAQILDDWQLRLALNLDGSVSLWLADEGDLQLEGGQKITFDTSSASVDDRVASARQLVSYRYTPAVVLVVGGGIVKNERATLEAVGEIGGSIVPLADAFRVIKISDEDARKAAVMSHDRRLLFIPLGEGVAEFDKWAYKYFRLPGGAERIAHKLPLLPGRGVVDSVGQFLPYRVFSESFAIVSTLATELLKIEAAAKAQTPKLAELERENLQKKAADFKARAAAAKAKAAEIKSGFDANFGNPDIRREAEAEAARQEQLAASLERQAKDAEKLATEADINVQNKAILKALDAVDANTEHFKAVVNLPFAEQSSGFRVDPERGLVIFEREQGQVARQGASLHEAELSQFFPRVELEFGYMLKPGPGDALSIKYRYHSVWVRRPSPDGKAQVIEQVKEVPPGSYPVVVSRPEFQQVDALDGSSNKGILDAKSRKIAEEIFAVPQSSVGAVVTFCRPVPVLVTGKVLSVTWSTDYEVPRVVAHVGTYSPLAPEKNDDLRTRAFGPLDGSVRQAVFLPRGIA